MVRQGEIFLLLSHANNNYVYFDSEFWANFLMYYVVEKQNATFYAGYTDYYTGSQLKNYYYSGNPQQSYINTIAKGIYHHDGLLYTFIKIKERTEWDAFKKTFAYFNGLSYNEVPASNLGKLNLFPNKLKDYSGVDVFAMITASERAVYERQLGGKIEYSQTYATWYKMNVESNSIYVKEPNENSTTLEATVVNGSGKAVKYVYENGLWKIDGGLAYIPGGGITVASIGQGQMYLATDNVMISPSSLVGDVIVNIQNSVNGLIDGIALNLGYDSSIMTSKDWSNVGLGITLGLVDTICPKLGFLNLRGGVKSLLLIVLGKSESSLNADYYYISAKTQTEFSIFVTATVAAASSYAAAGTALSAAGVTATATAVTVAGTGGLGFPAYITMGVSSISSLVASGICFVAGAALTLVVPIYTL